MFDDPEEFRRFQDDRWQEVLGLASLYKEYALSNPKFDRDTQLEIVKIAERETLRNFAEFENEIPIAFCF